MAYATTGDKEITAELLTELVTAKQLAQAVGCTVAQVRRAARKSQIPGAYTALGKVGFDLAIAGKWVPPEPGVGGFARREDGRQGYKVYANDEEIAAIAQLVGAEQVVDPREVRKARKAKKAAEAAEAEADDGEGDPFDDFDLDE